jgi:hypothetical protein
MPVCPFDVARSEPSLGHLFHCLSASGPLFLPAEMVRMEVTKPPDAIAGFCSLSVPHSRHDMAPDHVVVILPTLQHPQQFPQCQPINVLDMPKA